MGNRRFYRFLMKWQRIYAKNNAVKMNQSKVHDLTVSSNFADFWRKNNIFTQNDPGFKNISHKKWSEFNNQWRKSRVLPDICQNNSVRMKNKK